MPALPPVRRECANSLADGLRSMALIGMGLTWLSERLVREDLTARRLACAGGVENDMHLSVRLLRKAMRLGGSAEDLWGRLNDDSTQAHVGAVVRHKLRAA